MRYRTVTMVQAEVSVEVGYLALRFDLWLTKGVSGKRSRILRKLLCQLKDKERMREEKWY